MFKHLLTLFVALLGLALNAFSQGKSHLTLPTDEKNIYDLCYSSSGNTLIVADGVNIRWFSENYDLLAVSNKVHNDKILSINLSVDSTLLITGGRDSVICILDVKKNKVLNKLSFHHGIVTSVKISPDKRFILSGGSDNKLVLYDLYNQSIKHIFADHTKEVTSVAFSPDQKLLSSCGADGIVNVYDLLSNDKIYSYSIGGWAREISFNMDGSKFIVCGDNSRIFTFIIDESHHIKLLNSSRTGQGWILTAKLHTDNFSVVSGGLNGILKIFTTFGIYTAKLGVPINDVEFRPNNGSYIKLAVATQGKGVKIIEAKEMNIK
jgi:WD40 repeat protein